MSSLVLLATMLVAGFEPGGQIAGVYPFGGLGRFHSSSALIGVGLGYAAGPARFELGYRYANLPGVQQSPYRLSLHQPSLGLGYAFLRRGNWGFEALAGAGLAFAERALGSGRETGTAGSAELGLGFFQYAGHSRLSLGLAHTAFIENGGAGVTLAHLFALRAGVAYVP